MHREGIPKACFWPLGYYTEIWDSTASLFKPPTITPSSVSRNYHSARVVTMQETTLSGPVLEEAEPSSFMMDINLLITLLFCVLGTPDMLFYSCFFR